MKMEQMLPDYLDVVFLDRNKAYGGYELRSNYSKRMRNGALLAFAATGPLSVMMIMSERHTPTICPPYIPPPVVFKEYHPVEPPMPPRPKVHTGSSLPPAVSAAPKVHTDVRTVPLVVVDKTPDDKILRPNDDLKTAQPSLSKETGADVPTGSGGNNNAGNGTGDGKEVEGIGPSVPASYADQMPEFPGDINKYLSDHMHYPDAAREAGIDGKVIIRFIVNEDGSISGAEVVRGIGGACDQEALRVVRGMPRWRPGKQNGRAVKVYYVLPVIFVLQ